MFLVAVNFHGGVDLPRVDVHAVLPLLGKSDMEGDDVLVVWGEAVADILAQPLLLQPVLVEGGHEVCEGARHPESDVELASGKDEGLLV